MKSTKTGDAVQERKITLTSTGYDPAVGRAVRDPTLESNRPASVVNVDRPWPTYEPIKL